MFLFLFGIYHIYQVVGASTFYCIYIIYIIIYLRPKKNIISVEAEEGMEKECRLCQDSEEEIEVEKVEIEERWYYKTNEDVLLDIKNHNICGILVNGKIKSIDNK